MCDSSQQKHTSGRLPSFVDNKARKKEKKKMINCKENKNLNHSFFFFGYILLKTVNMMLTQLQLASKTMKQVVTS